jgi:hypothetical protein
VLRRPSRRIRILARSALPPLPNLAEGVVYPVVLLQLDGVGPLARVQPLDQRADLEEARQPACHQVAHAGGAAWGRWGARGGGDRLSKGDAPAPDGSWGCRSCPMPRPVASRPAPPPLLPSSGLQTTLGATSSSWISSSGPACDLAIFGQRGGGCREVGRAWRWDARWPRAAWLPAISCRQARRARWPRPRLVGVHLCQQVGRAGGDGGPKAVHHDAAHVLDVVPPGGGGLAELQGRGKGLGRGSTGSVVGKGWPQSEQV